ncbi:hypothetical protein BJ742DRAFT_143727 [Cladochytrium replicatum]|nr:hypothetical protein BJ742DRAFT_143727 [Cladochytrium replicatum]
MLPDRSAYPPAVLSNPWANLAQQSPDPSSSPWLIQNQSSIDAASFQIHKAKSHPALLHSPIPSGAQPPLGRDARLPTRASLPQLLNGDASTGRARHGTPADARHAGRLQSMVSADSLAPGRLQQLTQDSGGRRHSILSNGSGPFSRRSSGADPQPGVRRPSISHTNDAMQKSSQDSSPYPILSFQITEDSLVDDIVNIFLTHDCIFMSDLDIDAHYKHTNAGRALPWWHFSNGFNDFFEQWLIPHSKDKLGLIVAIASESRTCDGFTMDAVKKVLEDGDLGTVKELRDPMSIRGRANERTRYIYLRYKIPQSSGLTTATPSLSSRRGSSVAPSILTQRRDSFHTENSDHAEDYEGLRVHALIERGIEIDLGDLSGLYHISEELGLFSDYALFHGIQDSAILSRTPTLDHELSDSTISAYDSLGRNSTASRRASIGTPTTAYIEPPKPKLVFNALRSDWNHTLRSILTHSHRDCCRVFLASETREVRPDLVERNAAVVRETTGAEAASKEQVSLTEESERVILRGARPNAVGTHNATGPRAAIGSSRPSVRDDNDAIVQPMQTTRPRAYTAPGQYSGFDPSSGSIHRTQSMDTMAIPQQSPPPPPTLRQAQIQEQLQAPYILEQRREQRLAFLARQREEQLQEQQQQQQQLLLQQQQQQQLLLQQQQREYIQSMVATRSYLLNNPMPTDPFFASTVDNAGTPWNGTTTPPNWDQQQSNSDPYAYARKPPVERGPDGGYQTYQGYDPGRYGGGWATQNLFGRNGPQMPNLTSPPQTPQSQRSRAYYVNSGLIQSLRDMGLDDDGGHC